MRSQFGLALFLAILLALIAFVYKPTSNVPPANNQAYVQVQRHSDIIPIGAEDPGVGGGGNGGYDSECPYSYLDANNTISARIFTEAACVPPGPGGETPTSMCNRSFDPDGANPGAYAQVLAGSKVYVQHAAEVLCYNKLGLPYDTSDVGDPIFPLPEYSNDHQPPPLFFCHNDRCPDYYGLLSDPVCYPTDNVRSFVRANGLCHRSSNNVYDGIVCRVEGYGFTNGTRIGQCRLPF